MGNNHGRDQTDHVAKPHQQKLETLYNKLCYNGGLNYALFETHFRGPTDIVTRNLFNQFFIDLASSSSSEAKSLFVERCHKILENTEGTYYEQIRFLFDVISTKASALSCEDVTKIIHCFCIFGVYQASLDDEDFKPPSHDVDIGNQLISSITRTIMNGAESIQREEVMNWVNNNFRAIGYGVQTWLQKRLVGTINRNNCETLPQPSECSTSKCILTPSCLWFLCCNLPSCYTYMENKFKIDTQDGLDMSNMKFTWNLLYDSNQHGLSLNRFKNKIMDYKSPTVTLFEFSSGLIVVLALDEKWMDSPVKYGDVYCQLIELSPTVNVVEANSKMVYLKEVGRSVPTGLLIGGALKPKISISTDLNTADIHYKNQLNEQVERMEVWGCGGVDALKSQKDVKNWELKETEKRKKVKLPGQWDADKSILEMGGVRVNHSERGDMR